MRLIDADALVKDFNICFGGVSHAVIAKELIDNAPTIEAEPVRHGRWLVDSRTEMSFCSECWDYAVEADTNYCPNCGARMDGDTE